MLYVISHVKSMLIEFKVLIFSFSINPIFVQRFDDFEFFMFYFTFVELSFEI